MMAIKNDSPEKQQEKAAEPFTRLSSGRAQCREIETSSQYLNWIAKMTYTKYKFLLLVPLLAIVAGCSSIRVTKLDSSKDPDGIPFYLTKQIVQVTTTTTTIRKISTMEEVSKYKSVERQIVEVIDPANAFVVNKTKPFVGESKFSVERTTSSNLTKVAVEDSEGLTEFLKGIFEGAKTLTEAAKTAASFGGAAPLPAPAVSGDTEKALLAAGYYAEQSIIVTYEPAP